RGIVTLEPKERNDAIDRLLGLSDYRNLLTGVTDANARGFQRQIDDAIASFEGRVRTALAQIDRGLEEGRRDAEAVGVLRHRITQDTAIGIATSAAEGLKRLAQEFGLESRLAVTPTRWQELPVFETSLRAEIQRLRAAVPEQTEQSRLYQRKSELDSK